RLRDRRSARLRTVGGLFGAVARSAAPPRLCRRRPQDRRRLDLRATLPSAARGLPGSGAAQTGGVISRSGRLSSLPAGRQARKPAPHSYPDGNPRRARFPSMPGSVAKLALQDGTVYTGHGFGAAGETFGEVVFNTSMTGYQEVLTDPSYKGQIVTMTYPLIGNYGINAEDRESTAPQVEGFIVRELARAPSNFRSHTSLDAYLKENNILGLEGIDTRALVRRLRVRGAMTGVLSTTDLNDISLVPKAQNCPSIIGRDLVREVVPKESFAWTEGFISPFASQDLHPGHARPH